MARYGILAPAPFKSLHDERVWQAPAYVTAMLQNMHLVHHSTALPVEYGGDFWYWILTAFGLDLMRALVRASSNGFSYAETFMEPEIARIPQLVLLEAVTSMIQVQNTEPYSQPDWSSVFCQSQFLYERQVFIDPQMFQQQADVLTRQIKQSCYDAAGSRIYTSPHRAYLGSQNIGQ